MYKVLKTHKKMWYGDVTRGPRVVNENTKAEMKKILEELVFLTLIPTVSLLNLLQININHLFLLISTRKISPPIM